jgi:hypothetical protein
LLDILGKRIDHRAFVLAVVCPKEPATNERVDFAAVKFDRKAAKASAPSCPATTHSACGGFPCNNGLCRYVIYRRLAQRMAHAFAGKRVIPCPPGARLLRCTPLSFSYGYRLHFRFRRYTVASSGLAATAERNEV